jgi:hypothetical protein
VYLFLGKELLESRGFSREVTGKLRESSHHIDYYCIGGIGGTVGFFFPKIPKPISPPNMKKREIPKINSFSSMCCLWGAPG